MFYLLTPIRKAVLFPNCLVSPTCHINRWQIKLQPLYQCLGRIIVTIIWRKNLIKEILRSGDEVFKNKHNDFACSLSAIRYFPVQLTGFPKHVQTNTLVYWLHSPRIWLKLPRTAHSKDRTWLTFFPKSEDYLANAWPHSTILVLNSPCWSQKIALLSHSSTVSELSLSCANSLCLTCPPTFLFLFQPIWKPARAREVPRTQWFMSVYTSYSMCR